MIDLSKKEIVKLMQTQNRHMKSFTQKTIKDVVDKTIKKNNLLSEHDGKELIKDKVIKNMSKALSGFRIAANKSMRKYVEHGLVNLGFQKSLDDCQNKIDKIYSEMELVISEAYL